MHRRASLGYFPEQGTVPSEGEKDQVLTPSGSETMTPARCMELFFTPTLHLEPLYLGGARQGLLAPSAGEKTEARGLGLAQGHPTTETEPGLD